MVAVLQPIVIDSVAIDLGIGAGEAGRHKYCRDSAAHERKLVAADEDGLFRERIGTYLIAHSFRRGIEVCFHRSMLGAESYDVFQWKEGVQLVHVDVGDDLLQRNRWVEGEVVRALQTFLFPGVIQENERAFGSFWQLAEGARDLHQGSRAA